jgi:hypothetical protein
VKTNAWLILALVAMGIVPPPQIMAEADRSARDLLEHYARYVQGLETIQYRLRERTTAKGGSFSDLTWTNSSEATFVKLDARWRCRSHAVGLVRLKVKTSPVETESESTFDGKTSIYVNRVDRTTQELADFDEAAVEKLLRSGMRGRVETMAVAEVDAERPTSAGEYKIQNQSCNLYGYLPADRLTVTDLLRDTTTRLVTRTEMLEGRRCRVLEGQTAHGQVTLWLDPAAAFAPVRLRVVKGEADLLDKVPMRTLKAETSELSPYPKLPMRGMEIQIDYRLGTVAGRPMIVGYTRLDRFLYEGGSDYLRRDEGNLSEIRFDPAPAALEPSLAIPDGTKVVVRNSPSLRAKWSGGKLVLDYDKPTVAKLSGEWQSETSDKSPWGRPLVLGTVAIVTLSLMCLVWAYWRRRY